MNDNDREEWINNDEGLYLSWKSSRMSMRQFIRENRDDLDKIINGYIERQGGGY